MNRKLLMRLIAIAIATVNISSFYSINSYADNNYNTQAYSSSLGTWKQVGDLWYFYDYNNVMKTGWILDLGEWYYLDEQGVMQTGVIQVNGKVYLLNDHGAMQKGPAIIDGVMYNFDSQGVLIGNQYPKINRAFTSFGESTLIYSPDLTINNESSTPDDPSVPNEEANKTTRYTIEFRNEDGDTIKSQSAYKGEKVVLYKPIKENYDFDCWSTKSDGEGKTYDPLSDITVNDDIVLYANWNKEEDNDEYNSKIFTSAITIVSDKNSHEITNNKGSIKLYAEVVPEKTTNKSVTWEIEDGKDKASISTDGILTAINNGDVTVIAKARDGSNVVGRTVITISGQEEGNNTPNDNNGGNSNNNNNGNNSNDNGTIIAPEKPVSSIEITSQPKLNYEFNEKLDLSGLRVKVHYADGSVSEEIPYDKFNNYGVYIKNYKNGQELEKSYVGRNQCLVIACGEKVVNSNNLNMNVVEGPSIVKNQTIYDKNNKQDVVFDYKDGTIKDIVKNVEILENNKSLDSNSFKVDYTNKKIIIGKDYIDTHATGNLKLSISLKDSNNSELINMICIIEIKDSEVKTAPTNFIKLEKGNKNSTTKITILNKESDNVESKDANYNIKELEYCITNKNLSTDSDNSVKWKNCSDTIQEKVSPNEYINIRKKAEKNTKPSLVVSKKVTEDCIAKISSANTLKSFKLMDKDNNIYNGVIEGSNITVIANKQGGTNKEVDITELRPIVEYKGTAEETKNIRLKISDTEMIKEGNTSDSINYKTPLSYAESTINPIECRVIAESGEDNIYNIKVYAVKPQVVQIRPNKTFVETVTVDKIVFDKNGHAVLDDNNQPLKQPVEEKKSKTIDYDKLYTDAGIDFVLTTPGVAKIKVRNPLSTDHYKKMEDVIKYTKIGDENKNAQVGLIFKDAPKNARTLKISSTLEGLKNTENIISLEGYNNVFVENNSYLKYVEVATRRSTMGSSDTTDTTNSGTSIWEYIYNQDDEHNKSNDFYYAWVDNEQNIIEYSKLCIKVEENTH